MPSTVSTVVHTLSQALRERAAGAFRAATRRERTLRIGVDIRPFYEPLTGIGWYLYHLLHEIAKHDDVKLYLFGDARLTDLGPTLHADLPPHARLCWFDLRRQGVISGRSRALTAAAYVAWMKLIDVDVMFGVNYFLPRLLGAVARRRVVTIHDLTYKRFPELLQKETLTNLEHHMQREIAIADAVICVSESTRGDLLHYYDIDPSRAVTIHSGLTAPTADPQLPIPDLPDRYILFVSTIEPRKNLDVLLDAYARLRARGVYDGALVVVGRVGWKAESIVPRLRAPGVHHLDYVAAPQLAAVYRNAELFVFPSIYEGFGFPLLEAMANGVPSIAARSSSLPEIGGDAALYFDPRDTKALEAQIERVLADAALREQLAEAGVAQAARFRWDVAAEQTLDVLRRCAGLT
ncbi:MAG TPA: glycosyltransferase family 1 protein [Thermoanaerobaculia bacterium]|jgi:glycosyltransferase involved in cell wall biosynthesis|nr:glycosyltransferase family 1 protein [Thermoanaerobaculia bacterium]